MEISGKRFLLAGGASLIGSHVAEQLIAAGAAEVILYDNYSLSIPEVVETVAKDPKVKLVRGDVLRLTELIDALENVDGVYAFAALLTLPLSQNPSLGLDVNVRGMVNLLEACRIRKVKKLVFSSSVAVYGQPEADSVDEGTPFAWDKSPPALALYASSKIIGENLCRLYAQKFGIEFVALRYSTVYGERQHRRGINAMIILDAYSRIKQGEAPVIPGDGTNVYDYVYVGDVARANVMAMASPLSGESFIISSGTDTSVNDVIGHVLRVAGSDLKPVYNDDPNRVKTAMKTSLGYSPAKAKALLGWEAQVGVAEGIRRVLAWVDASSGT